MSLTVTTADDLLSTNTGADKCHTLLNCTMLCLVEISPSEGLEHTECVLRHRATKWQP